MPAIRHPKDFLAGLIFVAFGVAAIDRVREAVKKGAGCRLALPPNHAAFPRNAAQLKELGAGYSNCAPTPEARLLRSMSEQAAAQRKLLTG